MRVTSLWLLTQPLRALAGEGLSLARFMLSDEAKEIPMCEYDDTTLCVACGASLGWEGIDEVIDGENYGPHAHEITEAFFEMYPEARDDGLELGWRHAGCCPCDQYQESLMGEVSAWLAQQRS